LWPDVQVDFDQGLHFCVRQVRAALDDSPTDPRYIETLPRRGYRLLAPVGTVDEVAAPDQQRPGEPRALVRPRSRWHAVALGLAIVLAVVAFALLPRALEERSAPVSDVAPTVAIMSMRPPSAPDLAGPRAIDGARIAELLLERLGGLGPDRLGVIGPTTTAAYGEGLRQVAELIDDLGVDYVISGRYSDDSSLLVEIIRGSDGVHLWVERFAPSTGEPSEATRCRW
jgi:hypothetical protein